jgi:chemotaxis methyl-accepting protein methylase
MKNATIIKSNKELNTYEKYDLINSPSISALKTLENREIIGVGNWCIYSTTDNNGRTMEILSIQDSFTGMVYAGQSETFRNEFEKILDIVSSMGETDFYIEALTRKSKAGRDYLLCALVSPENVQKRLGFSAMNEPLK